MHTPYRVTSNSALPDRSRGLMHSYSRCITHERMVCALCVGCMVVDWTIRTALCHTSLLSIFSSSHYSISGRGFYVSVPFFLHWYDVGMHCAFPAVLTLFPASSHGGENRMDRGPKMARSVHPATSFIRSLTIHHESMDIQKQTEI